MSEFLRKLKALHCNIQNFQHIILLQKYIILNNNYFCTLENFNKIKYSIYFCLFI